MKVFIKFFLGAIFLLMVVTGYFYFYQKVLWSSQNGAKVRLVSMVNLRKYYKEVFDKKLGFLLIRYETMPKNTNEKNRIYALDNKELYWNCYWRKIKIFGIQTFLWETGIYFDIDKIVNNHDIVAANQIINRNICSCLTNIRSSFEKMDIEQERELDNINFEKMKSYNNGQIFEIIYRK